MDQETERIRRPVNAFMLWAKTERKRLAKELATDDNPALSKVLGQRWKEMAKDQKRLFMMQAEEIRQEHFKQHPEFKYSKRRGPKPKRKTIETEPNPISVSQPEPQRVDAVHGNFYANGHGEGVQAVGDVVNTVEKGESVANSDSVEPMPINNEAYSYTEPFMPQSQPQPGQYEYQNCAYSFSAINRTEITGISDFSDYTPSIDPLTVNNNDYMEIWTRDTSTPAYRSGYAYLGEELDGTTWTTAPFDGYSPVEVNPTEEISLANLLAPLRE